MKNPVIRDVYSYPPFCTDDASRWFHFPGKANAGRQHPHHIQSSRNKPLQAQVVPLTMNGYFREVVLSLTFRVVITLRRLQDPEFSIFRLHVVETPSVRCHDVVVFAVAGVWRTSFASCSVNFSPLRGGTCWCTTGNAAASISRSGFLSVVACFHIRRRRVPICMENVPGARPQFVRGMPTAGQAGFIERLLLGWARRI